MNDNFPTKFGMEPDLCKCIGKTLERVEMLAMEFGSVSQTAYAVRFTDGSRAFFGARVGTGIMNPQIDGQQYHLKTVETSEIFTKPEYAEMVNARERHAEARRRDHERAERRQYEALREKFADAPTEGRA